VTSTDYIVLVWHGELMDPPDAVGGFDTRAAAVAWVTSARDDGSLTDEHDTQVLPVYDHRSYQR
jgi:hypothetical protein